MRVSQKSPEHHLSIVSHSETSPPGIELSARLFHILAQTKTATVPPTLETLRYRDGWCVMKAYKQSGESEGFFQAHTHTHLSATCSVSSTSFAGNRSQHQSFTAGRSWRAEGVERDQLCGVCVCVWECVCGHSSYHSPASVMDCCLER